MGQNEKATSKCVKNISTLALLTTALRPQR